VALRHSDLTAPDGPRPVLDEVWTVRAYNLADHFLVDLESEQCCATDDPLIINECNYGGMAIRGSGQWFDAEVAKRISKLTKAKAAPDELARVAIKRDYLTSEGKTWIDGNHTRARWVEMHGTIDGNPTGVAVLCHPGNFRAPQPVRLHPHKPYFCFAPMVLGEFQIRSGSVYTSRYRYYVHCGEVNADMCERVWHNYASPPTVRVVVVSPAKASTDTKGSRHARKP